jgi:uncharacterized damage-inducible protein DinB
MLSGMKDFRYPIGTFTAPDQITPDIRSSWIEEISALPGKMRAAGAKLTEDQLQTPYREGGWTLRQVIHHTADSHMNAYIRFKWTLTETNPVIKAYDEAKWAELSDTQDTPIETSLKLLGALHERWVYLMSGMSDKDFKLSFIHPEKLASAAAATGLSAEELVKNIASPDIADYVMSLEKVVGLYAWHGNHHLAHVTTTLELMGW